MKWTLGGQEVQNHWDGTNRWEKPKHTARPRKGQAPSSRTQYQNKYSSLQIEGKTPQGSRGTKGNQRIAKEEWDRMSQEEREREIDRKKMVKAEQLVARLKKRGRPAWQQPNPGIIKQVLRR